MNELEKLLLEKKALETKIRALKSPEYIRCGSVKIEKKDQDSDIWRVYAMTEYTQTEYESRESFKERTGKSDFYYYIERKAVAKIRTSRWWPFIKEETKEQTIKTIKQVSKDLNELIRKLEEEQ